jgi:hypothetical protein
MKTTGRVTTHWLQDDGVEDSRELVWCDDSECVGRPAGASSAAPIVIMVADDHIGPVAAVAKLRRLANLIERNARLHENPFGSTGEQHA